MRSTFARYRATVECREAELEAVEADLALYIEEEPFAAAVRRLSSYRGVDRLGGLVLQAEICDWRRFANGAAAGAFCGLVPTEYSSGEKVRRGSLTHAGNAHLRRQLIESAWAYTTGPSLGVALRRRQEGVPAETSSACVGLPGRAVPALPGPRQAQVGAGCGRSRHRPAAYWPPPYRDGGLIWPLPVAHRPSAAGERESP